jgi:hypothetical protein
MISVAAHLMLFLAAAAVAGQDVCESAHTCVAGFFPNARHRSCVAELIEKEPSLGKEYRLPACASDSLAMPCNRTQWRVAADSCNFLNCSIFKSETHCLRVSTAPVCGGSLAGMCGDYFGFPLRNCSDMPSAEFSSEHCPVTNVIQICDACHVFVTNVAMRYYATSGVKSENPFSEVVYFNGDRLKYTSFALLRRDLDVLVQKLSCRVFLTSSAYVYFHHLREAYSSAFFVVTLDTPLPNIVVPSNLFYFSGRLDLLTYIAGATLVGESARRRGVWISNETTGESGLRRVLFMGMASAVHNYGGPNATPIFLRTQMEAFALRERDRLLRDSSSANVFDFVLSLSASSIFPFLKEAYTMGIITDFLTDANFQRSGVDMEKRHLLGSATADLFSPIRALFTGTARGFFQSGVFTGDVSSMILVPCSPDVSCSEMSVEANSSQIRAFREMLDMKFDLKILYNFFERSLPEIAVPASSHTPLSGIAPLSSAVTGLMVWMENPQVLFVTSSVIILLNLQSETFPLLTFSLETLHVQQSYITPQSAVLELVGRRRYASAVDPTSGTVFVSMGMNPDGTLVSAGDVWSAKFPWTFYLEPTFGRIDAAGGAPPAARVGHSLLYHQDTLYLFGGYLCGDDCGDIFALNISTGVWRRMPQLEEAAAHRTFPQLTGGSMGEQRRTVGLVLARSTILGNLKGSAWLLYFGGAGADFDVAAFRLPTVSDEPAGDSASSDVGQWVFLNSTGRGEALLRNVTVMCAAVVHTPSEVILVVGSRGEWFLFNLDFTQAEIFSWGELPPSTSCAAAANAQLAVNSHSTALLFHSGMSRITGGSNNDTNTAWVFRSLRSPDCHLLDRHVISFSGLQCVECPAGLVASAYGQCVAPPNTGYMVIILSTVASALFLFTATLRLRAFLIQQRLNRLLDAERIAEKLADCVADMNLKDLQFLYSAIEVPNRMQRAFLEILDVLSVYLLFIPMWVRLADHFAESTTSDDPVSARSTPRRKSVVFLESLPENSSSIERPHVRQTVHSLRQLPSGNVFRTKVVVMTTQIRGQLAVLSSTDSVSALSEVLSFISDVTRDCGGILEWTTGDTAIASFNGLRRNISGVLSAARAAARISEFAAARVGALLLSHPSSPSRPKPVLPRCVSSGIAEAAGLAGVVGRVHGLHSYLKSPAVQESATLASMARAMDAAAAMREEDGLKTLAGVVACIVRGRARLSESTPDVYELISAVLGLTAGFSARQLASWEVRNEVLAAVFARKMVHASTLFAQSSEVLEDADLHDVRHALDVGQLPVIPTFSAP